MKHLSNWIEIPMKGMERYGAAGGELQARLAEEPTDEWKVDLLQAFLLRLLGRADYADEIVRHAVGIIQQRGGLITINELTEKVGYSQPYLAMKFDRLVGLGPKTLAEVVRFQNRFVALTRFGCAAGGTGFDEDYYDQSHFSREFKRFVGFPPATYLKKTNEFLTMFYRGASSSSRGRSPPSVKNWAE
jgi:AraC-like DNA-binding protein